jgi:acyl-coenzyme A thioesterase PaaI-like protein
MSVDYAAMATGYQGLIPFAKFIGLQVKSIGPGVATVVLPEAPTTMNHVQSQHAGALFTAGESASGGAFIGTFAERMGEITPLAQSAEITYKKIARGDITANATFNADTAAIFEELDREGKVRFTVQVELVDAEANVVAEMSVQWYVRKNT